MKIGVKYCGGCNPLFDRGKLLKKIKENSKDGVQFFSVEADETYDGIIVLCGCKSRCAEYSELKYVDFLIILDNDNDYRKVLEKVGK